MKNLKVVIVLFVSLLILQSCAQKQNEEVDAGVAPSLPPVEAFIMPFTNYEDADTTEFAPTGGNGTAEGRSTIYENWFHSVSNVIVWNNFVALSTTVPTAAFLEAFNHDPVAQGNGLWLWEYDFTGNPNNTYTAKLYGEVLAPGEVKWDMYVSQANGFQDVLWYTGTTTSTQSTWTLKHRPNNPEAFLKIEHQKENGTGEMSIRYTNIIPNHPDNGDYIEYRQDNTATAEFNRAYDLYKIVEDHLIEIQWNRPEVDGRVKDEVKFGDTEWHCWGVDKKNIDC